MIVIYGSFLVGAPDRAAFEEWFRDLAAKCREQDGCVFYDYVVNPDRPERGGIVEVWETKEALDRHLIFPPHVEMIEDGSRKWGMSDTTFHMWTQADGHSVHIRPTTHDGRLTAEGTGA
jgi:quinol monooxygenase YgiN